MLSKAYKLLSDNNKIIIEGVYTHLATSGINDIYYKTQVENFLEINIYIVISFHKCFFFHLFISLHTFKNFFSFYSLIRTFAGDEEECCLLFIVYCLL